MVTLKHYIIQSEQFQQPKLRSQGQPHPGQKPQNKPPRETWFVYFLNPQTNLRIRVKADYLQMPLRFKKKTTPNP